MSFAHATLKTVPLITCEEGGTLLPGGGGARATGPLTHHARETREGAGEEIWTREVRGQGSSPDYRSIEEVADSQAST